MTGQTLPPGDDEMERLLASARQRVHDSRAMAAWSMARLFSTNQGLQPAETATGVLLHLLNCPCDLDVLIFFFRHPNTLLTLDDLAARVGHDVDDTRASIEVLLAAGLLGCSKERAEGLRSTALLYEFTPGAWNAILGPLLWVASSADGRRSLRRALTYGARQQSPKS